MRLPDVRGAIVFKTGRQDVTGPERANLQEWANYGLTFWSFAGVNF